MEIKFNIGYTVLGDGKVELHIDQNGIRTSSNIIDLGFNDTDNGKNNVTNSFNPSIKNRTSLQVEKDFTADNLKYANVLLDVLSFDTGLSVSEILEKSKLEISTAKVTSLLTMLIREDAIGRVVLRGRPLYTKKVLSIHDHRPINTTKNYTYLERLARLSRDTNTSESIVENTKIILDLLSFSSGMTVTEILNASKLDVSTSYITCVMEELSKNGTVHRVVIKGTPIYTRI